VEVAAVTMRQPNTEIELENYEQGEKRSELV
jgi:hypothetical protein